MSSSRSAWGPFWADADATIEFRPWQPAGLGLAYLFNSADITITDAGEKTDIEWEYKGPLLYLVLGF